MTDNLLFFDFISNSRYVMSRYKQLTHKEIADKLEVSVQTVNYRIGKALQFFRIRLKDFCLE